MPDGTFWEIAAFFILAAGALIAVCGWLRWLWPYLWRFRQFDLEIGSALCSDDYHADLPKDERYNRNQTITIDSPQKVTLLVRLQSKQKSVYFALRYLGNDGKDFPNAQIAFVEAKGFQAHEQYWSVDGHPNSEGSLKGRVQHPARRNAEKDCYMRVTAKVRQSCNGTLRFEGQYDVRGDRKLSAKADAKLDIQVTE